MGALERKFIAAGDADLSVKAEEGAPTRLVGYPSTFGNLDSYKDTVEPGAYAATIKTWRSRPQKLPMKLEHGGSLPIGIWPAELLAEEAKGLRGEGELTPRHSVAGDVEACVRHGSLSGLSIGYRAKRAEVDRKTGVRRLLEIDLVEISVVASPADSFARIEGLKAVAEADATAAVGHMRKARAALGQYTKAAADAADMVDAMRTAHDACGSAMECLGAPPTKAAQFRALRDWFREEFGLSRREAEEKAERFLARDAGDGVDLGDEDEGTLAGKRRPPGDDTPRDEAGGADVLAALRGFRLDPRSRIFR